MHYNFKNPACMLDGLSIPVMTGFKDLIQVKSGLFGGKNILKT